MSAENVAAVRVPTPSGQPSTQEFTLSLDNFQGPFDLLLTLISRRKLDITDIALAEVTDEFLSYINQLYADNSPYALSYASDFLVTAATLLNLKSARLLPRRQARIEKDQELLEARDLLFARLLQFRAYREVSALLRERWNLEENRFARSVALEPAFAKVLPELVMDITPHAFAQIAAAALSPRSEQQEPPQLSLDHLRLPQTTLAEQEVYIMQQVSRGSVFDFSADLLTAQSLEVAVVRFLALLELYKMGDLEMEQESALGAIMVRPGKHPQEMAQQSEVLGGKA